MDAYFASVDDGVPDLDLAVQRVFGRRLGCDNAAVLVCAHVKRWIAGAGCVRDDQRLSAWLHPTDKPAGPPLHSYEVCSGVVLPVSSARDGHVCAPAELSAPSGVIISSGKGGASLRIAPTGRRLHFWDHPSAEIT